MDPSEPFVAAVRTRYPGVDVRSASAEQLPFDDDAFDAAIAQLVVHFMTDPVAGLREMARVTRPGGVVAACVWDHAGDRGPLSLFWQVALDLDPGARDESHLAGTRQGHLTELFAAAGLREIEGASCRPTSSIRRSTSGGSPTPGASARPAAMTGLDEAHREAIREACRARVSEEPFVVAARAWAARGIV